MPARVLPSTFGAGLAFKAELYASRAAWRLALAGGDVALVGRLRGALLEDAPAEVMRFGGAGAGGVADEHAVGAGHRLVELLALERRVGRGQRGLHLALSQRLLRRGRVARSRRPAARRRSDPPPPPSRSRGSS